MSSAPISSASSCDDRCVPAPRGLRFLLARRPETTEEWVLAFVGAAVFYGAPALVALVVAHFVVGFPMPDLVPLLEWIAGVGVAAAAAAALWFRLRRS